MSEKKESKSTRRDCQRPPPYKPQVLAELRISQDRRGTQPTDWSMQSMCSARARKQRQNVGKKNEILACMAVRTDFSNDTSQRRGALDGKEMQVSVREANRWGQVKGRR